MLVSYQPMNFAKIGKSDITGSNIWDDTTKQIKICQVVRLIIPATATDPQDGRHQRRTCFDFRLCLSAGFEITDTNLGAGSVGAGAGSAGVTSYVEACKCAGTPTFTCGEC